MGAHHGLRAIAQAESGRGGEGDPQDRVGERAAADESVFEGIAVDHAVNLSEVVVASAFASKLGLRGVGRPARTRSAVRGWLAKRPPGAPSPPCPAMLRARAVSAAIVSRKLDIAV